MSEEHLMNGLLIIVVSGIFIFICIQTIKKFFPPKAFNSFASLSEIKQYYTSSIAIIKKNPWLLFFPLLLSLSNYLFKIPFFLYQRPDLSSMPEDFVNRVQSISVSDFVTSLVKTPNVLDYGFCGAITGNLVFLGFFLICCVTFKAESRKLKGYATADNTENVAYFEKILKYSLFLLIVIVFLTAAVILTSAHVNSQLFFILYSPVMMIIGIMSLSLFSLIEGVILFAVKDAILGKNQSFTMLLNKSLRVLKPLFLLNIIFAVMGYIPSVIRFPLTVSTFLDIGLGQSAVIPVLMNLASFFTYLNALATAFIFSAPFILIIYKTNLRDAFLLLFNFIKNNFTKYLIFVGTGIFILFLPTLLQIILNTQIHPLKLEYVLVETGISVIRIGLAVIFYIAMFAFVMDTRSNSPLSRGTVVQI